VFEDNKLFESHHQRLGTSSIRKGSNKIHNLVIRTRERWGSPGVIGFWGSVLIEIQTIKRIKKAKSRRRWTAKAWPNLPQRDQLTYICRWALTMKLFYAGGLLFDSVWLTIWFTDLGLFFIEPS